MPVDLDTSTFPPRWKGANFKGPRGAHQVERKAKRAKVKTREKKEKAESKKFDTKLSNRPCRWPKCDHDTKRRVCIGQLESAHKVAIKMGGDKNGTRTDRRGLMTVCHWIHQGSPFAIERHGRKWEPLDPERGSFGPVAFFRREPVEGRKGEWGPWTLLARETAPGVLER